MLRSGTANQRHSMIVVDDYDMAGLVVSQPESARMFLWVANFGGAAHPLAGGVLPCAVCHEPFAISLLAVFGCHTGEPSLIGIVKSKNLVPSALKAAYVEIVGHLNSFWRLCGDAACEGK